MRLLRKSLISLVMAAAVVSIPSVATARSSGGGAAADRHHNELHVVATDAGFRFQGRLTTGPATIHFTNRSHFPHALDLYRLAPGVTVRKVLSDVRANDWAAFGADLADGGPGNGNPNIISPGRSAVTVGDGLKA